MPEREAVLPPHASAAAATRLAAAHPPPGYTAPRLFGQGVSYTYDDVIFLPGHINFGAHQVPLLWVLPRAPRATLRQADSLRRSEVGLPAGDACLRRGCRSC